MCFGKEKDEKKNPLLPKSNTESSPRSLGRGNESIQSYGSPASHIAPRQERMDGPPTHAEVINASIQSLSGAMPKDSPLTRAVLPIERSHDILTHISRAGRDTNPASGSPKDESDDDSSHHEELEAVFMPPTTTRPDLLISAAQAKDSATVIRFLREEPALINTPGLYNSISSTPKLMLSVFDFLATMDRFEDGGFYTDFQEALNYSGGQTFGRSKPKSADAMKFNLANPFHKFTWHIIITKLSTPIQEAAIKYLIKFHSELYHEGSFQPHSTLKIAPLGQLVLHNLVGIVRGIAESAITFTSSLKAAQEKITDKTSEDIILFLDPESLPKKFYTLASGNSSNAENYAKIYQMLLKSAYFEEKIASLQEVFPSIYDEISSIVESKGSVSSVLKAKYSSHSNYSLLASCYSIMKQAKDLSQKFDWFANDVKEEWFVIGDDAMTVATRRTAGSIYSTAGFTVGDDTDEEGSGYDNGEEKGHSAATHVSFVGMSAHHLMASGGGHGFVDHGLVGVSGVLDE